MLKKEGLLGDFNPEGLEKMVLFVYTTKDFLDIERLMSEYTFTFSALNSLDSDDKRDLFLYPIKFMSTTIEMCLARKSQTKL